MQIGELARSTGTRVETVRFYEREGLLPAPSRSAGNYRVYGDAHVERLSFIRHCRGLDIALDEIRVLLHFKDAPSDDCAKVNVVLDAHIGHVAARIRDLRKLERQLRSLRRLCQQAQDSAHCGILAGLSKPSRRLEAARMAVGHVRSAHDVRGRAREGESTLRRRGTL